MSGPDLRRTWQARADAHAATSKAIARSSDFALMMVIYLAAGAVLTFGALVILTIAHAVLTTALNLGPTLDAFGQPGGGW